MSDELKTTCDRCGEPLEVILIKRQDGGEHTVIACGSGDCPDTLCPVPYDRALADAIERAKWPVASRLSDLEAVACQSSTGFGKGIYIIEQQPGIFRRVSQAAAKGTDAVTAWLGDKGPLPFRRWVEAEKAFGLVAGEPAKTPAEEK